MAALAHQVAAVRPALAANRPATRTRRPLRAAAVEATNNASDARAWIEAWRGKQSKGASGASTPPKAPAAMGDEVAFSASQLDGVSWEDALKKLNM
mmetsp:Transcript_38508/g.69026  ORF Transcript_38508/g.69026 Transcript_38508/m.69026 type:complete len:96 (+) Transcript_38508:211-498(+)